MNVIIHMIGGGQLSLALDAENLEDVASMLRHERGLLGNAMPNVDGEALGRILVPANRIQLIAEV